MRETKFRILKRDPNYSIDADKADWTWEYITLPDDLIGEGYYAQEAYRWQTFSQWTALLDRNGKEIYEGDIVEVIVWKDGWAKSKKETYKIMFDNYDMALNLYSPEDDPDKTAPNETLGYLQGTRDIDSIEVIGNIYEQKRPY